SGGGATALRLNVRGPFPKVARSSQPWAGGHKPVGLEAWEPGRATYHLGLIPGTVCVGTSECYVGGSCFGFAETTSQEIKTMKKHTICLWYNHDAEEAAEFCARTSPER